MSKLSGTSESGNQQAITPLRVLVVCTGNICRSPLAEYALRGQLDPAVFRIASAGTRAVPNGRVPQEQVQIAESLGITGISTHIARQVTAESIAQADLILTASRHRRRRVVRTVPSAVKYTFTIRELARVSQTITDEDLAFHMKNGNDPVRAGIAAANEIRGLAPRPSDPRDDDVVDPYGHEAAVYEESARQLMPAVRVIAQFLSHLAGTNLRQLSGTTGQGTHTPDPAHASTQPGRPVQLAQPAAQRLSTTQTSPISISQARPVATRWNGPLLHDPDARAHPQQHEPAQGQKAASPQETGAEQARSDTPADTPAATPRRRRGKHSQ